MILSGKSKGILTLRDNKGIIRSFGGKGTPWHKDKRFAENFKQV